MVDLAQAKVPIQQSRTIAQELQRLQEVVERQFHELRRRQEDVRRLFGEIEAAATSEDPDYGRHVFNTNIIAVRDHGVYVERLLTAIEALRSQIATLTYRLHGEEEDNDPNNNEDSE